jgi:hypothetical protein
LHERLIGKIDVGLWNWGPLLLFQLCFHVLPLSLEVNEVFLGYASVTAVADSVNDEKTKMKD